LKKTIKKSENKPQKSESLKAGINFRPELLEALQNCAHARIKAVIQFQDY
jgi:hypothetical protein